MSFISVLDNIGKVIEDIFKDAVPVATALEPIFDAFFPAWAELYEEALTFITNAETAFGAAQVKKAGTAKMALVVAQLHPKVVAKAASLKIESPSPAQTKAYAQSVVDGLKSYGATGSAKM
jgi:hypothetical protein